jgi:pimeloyl-ACP methyl ester carboxylesterase
MCNEVQPTPRRVSTNTSNRSLVFIHGADDNSKIWKSQVKHFGTDAFPIDLPGHGKRADDLPPESVSDYAKIVHEIIFHEQCIKAPMIVGHSLGGAIALTMALEYASEVSGLILISTGARLRVLPSILEKAHLASEVAYREWKACDTFDIMDKLYEIHLPTLIICGAKDLFTPVKYSHYMHDHIQGSTLCIIDKARHNVMREKPKQVNQAIDVWLSRHN